MTLGTLPAARATTTSARDSLLDGLLDALRSERRLLDELTTLMLRQRDAVATEDRESVDDSVHSVQRVLFTMGAARTRRKTLNVRLGFNEDTPLGEILDGLGQHATPAHHEAYGALQRAAQRLSSEVRVNRDALRRVIATSEEHIRLLAGAPATPRVGYGESASRTPGSSSPLLIDRQA